MASSSAASAASDPATRVPLLAGNTTGATYAKWRPQMQTHLMRQGIEERDYTKAIPQWAALVAAVDADAATAEQDAIALLLAAPAAVKSTATSSPTAMKGSTTPTTAAAPDTATVAAQKQVAALLGRGRKAFAILHSALPSDLRPLVADVPVGYAYGIWSFLEKKFRNTEQDSVASLWADLTTLSQESSESFDEYRARVESVVELLKHAKQSVPSGLLASILLWRLQPRYAPVILALKTADRLTDTDSIDWRQIAETINQFERSQLGLGEADSAAADRAMAARTSSRPAEAPWQKVGASSSTRLSSNTGGSAQTRGTPPGGLRCFRCNQPGHFIAECKQPRRSDKQRPAPRAQSKGASAGGAERLSQGGRTARGWSHDSSASSDDEKEVRPPQQRANMARAGHKPSTPPAPRRVESQEPPSSASRKVAAGLTFAAVAMALTAGAPTGQGEAEAKPDSKSLDAALKSTAKAVDSAATVSTTSNRDTLHNVRRCPPMPIRMANGEVLSAMYKGDLTMRLRVSGSSSRFVTVTIRDVYYHERFDANLLSWGAMRRRGWEMHSTKSGTYLVTPSGERVDASTRGDLTILEDVAAGRAYGMGGVVCMTADELLQLHRRLGHVSWRRLVEMCKGGRTVGVGDIRNMRTSELEKAEKAIRECAACAEGKAHRAALGHRGLDKGAEAGAVLHLDTAPLIVRDPTTGKKVTQYCLSAKDAYTEFWWTIICPSMVDVQQAVLDVIEHCQSLTGRYPRLIIADLGTEFNNRVVNEFCNRHGVQYQPSPARSKEMNGLAEKGVDTLKNHARAMLHAAGLGAAQHLYGAYAIRHFVYVWNRTHVGRRTDVTPFQAMTSREASVLNVGEFGCDVYLHQHRATRDTTFGRKAEPGVYLGHDSGQNCARVLVVRSGKVVLSRDVHFREGSYMHARALWERREDQIEPIDLDVADESSDGRESGREWEVESITGSRVEKGVLQYRCKWAGSGEETWEPAEMLLEDVPQLVQEYVDSESNVFPHAPAAAGGGASASSSAPGSAASNLRPSPQGLPAAARAAAPASSSSSSSSVPAHVASRPATRSHTRAAAVAGASAPVSHPVPVARRQEPTECKEDVEDSEESEARVAAAYAARCL